MLVVAILWLATALAQAQDQWICVPGEGGRWNCGQGGETPAASELPALEENAPPGPAIFNLPPPPGSPPRSLDAIDLLLPNPGPGAQPGADRFALVIASVSREDEIEDFVDSYGLDPSLVRFVPVVDGEVVRQVILWGSFASPPQAARAMAGMPSAVRAMRPQVAEIATMGAVPRPLSALDHEPPSVAQADTRAAPDPPTSPAPAVSASRDLAPAPASDTAAEIATDAPAADSQGAGEIPALAGDDPLAEPDAVADGNSVPALPPVQAEAPAEAADRRPAPPAVAEEPAQEVPARLADATSRQSPPSASAASENSPPAPPSAPVSRKRSRPASTAVATTSENSSPAPRVRQSNRPSGFQPAPGVITARDTAAFAALDDQHYTVQLTSLKRRDQVAPWLRRHGLPADRVYALQVDEGGGPRTLLLFGNFATFSAAQAATRSLPGTIRSPWVRRISPLKRTLRDSP